MCIRDRTAIQKAKAQEHLQKELSETGSKYQEAGSSVAGFAKKALGAVGIVMLSLIHISEPTRH
ncbi:hypothetical protein JMUB7555_27180 [Staphylococcus aureus]